MTISKRVLTKWRKEALVKVQELKGWESTIEYTQVVREQSERILLLTQELIDQELLKETK